MGVVDNTDQPYMHVYGDLFSNSHSDFKMSRDIGLKLTKLSVSRISTQKHFMII